MCEYTGSLKDAQRHIDIQLTDAEVTAAVKKILNEPEAVCANRTTPFLHLQQTTSCKNHIIFLSEVASVQIFSESVIISDKVMIRSGTRNHPKTNRRSRKINRSSQFVQRPRLLKNLSREGPLHPPIHQLMTMWVTRNQR